MFISYAQNFEDVILWRALKHVKNGFYIDVGAQDPIVDSVSKSFYDHGWRGIHAEATQRYADLIREHRPDEQVIQSAIGSGQGPLKFYEIQSTGLSTGDPSIAELHKAEGKTVFESEVEILPLSRLFDMAPNRDIHWLKIDVEGMEQSVIESWGTSDARPWIVVVEATLPNSQTPSHENWEPKLLGFGYSFAYFDGLSRFYVSKSHLELMDKFGPGPNYFDDFTLADTTIFVKETRDNALFEKEREARREIRALKSDLERVRHVYAAEAEAHQKTRDMLDAVLNSSSWRLTAPLRSLVDTSAQLQRAMRKGGALHATCRLRQLIGHLVTHLMLWARRRPRISRAALSVLRQFPALHRRVVLAAHARGMALSLSATETDSESEWNIDVELNKLEKFEELYKQIVVDPNA